MKKKYNVVVVGKTGVGKSSFINYIYGENRMKTGAGRPVTKKGFEYLDYMINDLPVRLYDSWGLEADKAEEWMEFLETELAKRGYTSNIEDWFHTVFYCISAGSSRVEEYDLKIIRMFLEKKYKVTVIFTKADQASLSDINEMKRVICTDEIIKMYDEIDIIPVVSDEKETRMGKTVQMGKDTVESAIEDGFLASVTKRVPEMCVSNISKEIKTWREKQVKYVDKELNRFKRKEIEEYLKNEISEFVHQLKTKIIVNSVDSDLRKVIAYYSETYSTLFPKGVHNFRLNELNTRISNQSLTFGDYLSALNVFNLDYFKDKWYGDELKSHLENIEKELIRNISQIKPQIESYIDGLIQGQKVR